MRLAKIGASGGERKSTSALSNKLIDAMRERVTPIAMLIDTLPTKTRFVFTQQDIIEGLITDIKRDNPEILQDRDFFISQVKSAYDRMVCHI
jgi:hypothetical protein